MKRQKNQFQGLSSAEVEERKRAGLDNREVKAPSKSVGQIIASNVLTYFNLIFLVIVILLILVGSYRDLTFLPIIIANTLIGIIQELRAKQVLDNLKVMHIPRAKVLRDGEVREVAVDELVQDDIVQLGAGDQIPADGEVVSGEVMVNEALLTGEADEIKKSAGDELMSGSFVVSGAVEMRLEKVGRESYASKLTLEARKMKTGEQSEIIRSLNKIVKAVGVIIIPIGAILFAQQYFGEGASVRASVQAMVAAVIGMIPEGLFLLASVTLVISAMKLARDQVLLHDMKSIETLARVDTLCVDKTGTITEEKMRVEKIEILEGGETSREILRKFVQAQAADNATMVALKEEMGEDLGEENEVKTGEDQARKVVGFSSRYKYSAVELEEGAFVLGAPEVVLREEYGKYQERIEKYGRKGYRVLVFGKYGGELDGKKLTQKVAPEALILLSNLIREKAAETFRYFYEQGVDIKVISGDNPVTVAQIAEKAGIKNIEKYVDARKLVTDTEIEQAVAEGTVFGRVTPEQKRKMVQALKRQGRTVAMTGDGVNDVLALKDADCSVAMASGSEAAVQAAQLVLLESDFSKMPDVVREGRRVVNNLETSGSLFLVKNIFSLLTALLVILFGIAYPLTPAQVSLISMFTIGAPAFLLSQIPNTDLIRGSFIKNVLVKAIPGGVTDMLLVVMMALVGEAAGFTAAEISTMSTILLSAIGLMVLYDVARPMDREKRLIWILLAGGLVFSIVFLKKLFNISDEVGVLPALLCTLFIGLAWPLLNLMSKVVKKYFSKL